MKIVIRLSNKIKGFTMVKFNTSQNKVYAEITDAFIENTFKTLKDTFGLSGGKEDISNILILRPLLKRLIGERYETEYKPKTNVQIHINLYDTADTVSIIQPSHMGFGKKIIG